MSAAPPERDDVVVSGSVDKTAQRPPLPPRRSRLAPGILVLLVALAAGLAWKWQHDKGSQVSALTQANAERAAALRANAFDACARSMWRACTAFLDQARTLDPAGESDAKVQEARRQAGAGSPSPSR